MTAALDFTVRRGAFGLRIATGLVLGGRVLLLAASGRTVGREP